MIIKLDEASSDVSPFKWKWKWKWNCTYICLHVKGMCGRSWRRTCITLRRSRWTRKMTHLDEFMHYDDWLGAIKKLFKVSSNVTRRTWLFLFWLPFLLHGLYSLRGWGNWGRNKWGKTGGPWEHRAKMERNKGTRTPLRYMHWASLSPSYRTTDFKYRD